MLSKLVQLPLLKRLIPSISIRILSLVKKNRGFFKITNIKMYLDFLDPVDREIILHQKFEYLEFNYLIKKINIYKITKFYDIGANCGYYSIFVASKINNIKIISFEPNEEAYLKFSKTLKINNDLAEKIDLKNFGLSNSAGKFKMQSKIKFGYAQSGGTSVIEDNFVDSNSISLGNFKIGDEEIKSTNERIAMKIDVEGHELKVLKGLKKTLIQNKCFVQIEIFEKNFIMVNSYLNSLGYKLVYKFKINSNFFYSNFISE